VVVLSDGVLPKRLGVLNALFDAEESSQVTSATPVKLSRGPFPVKIAGDRGLDELEVAITEVEEGCTFRGVSPLVEVGEVCVRLKLSHVDNFLVDGVRSVDEERRRLLFEELNKSVDRTNKPWNRDDMVQDSQPDFLGVAVDKVLDGQLEGL
jgi:hypothetical protein